MASKLHNYLRTHRKRSGLTQREVAVLLGCEYGTKISRYERHTRIPSVETLIALEVVFQVPTSELFAGYYATVEENVRHRVRRMKRELKRRPETPVRKQKLDSLEKILSATKR